VIAICIIAINRQKIAPRYERYYLRFYSNFPFYIYINYINHHLNHLSYKLRYIIDYAIGISSYGE